MGYYLKAAAGVLITLASFALFAVSLVELIQIGTCASGGPYQIARPCPEGTGKWVAGIFASVPAGLIGMALFAFRGDPPNGKPKTSAIGWGTLAFGLFFLGTALAAAYGQWGPDATDNGADLGIGIMVAVFALIGLGALGIALGSWRLDRLDRRDQSRTSTQGSAVAHSAPAGQFSSEGLRKLAEMQVANPSTEAVAAPTPNPSPTPMPAPTLTRSGTATLKAFKYLGESRDDATLVELELEVDSGDGNAYSLVHKSMVPLAETRGLTTGRELRVRIDRQNPAAIEVQW